MFGLFSRKKERQEDEDDGSDMVDEEDDEKQEGLCIECGDQPATLHCMVCNDRFCVVCFKAQHRKGKRAEHKTVGITTTAVMTKKAREIAVALAEDPISSRHSADSAAPPPLVGGVVSVADWFLERARYIPLRLSMKERKILRTLEAALSVCDYTSRIDTPTLAASPPKRFARQMKEIMGLLVGILTAFSAQEGEKLAETQNLETYKGFFQEVFEVGRRHKIMNPEKMRAEYGKLIYVLQDCMRPEIAKELKFSCVTPIHTVYSHLESHGGLALLRDERMVTATREIVDDGIKSREQIRREIKQKEAAIEQLSKQYAVPHRLSSETIKRCIYSINDNNSFLTFNRDPVDKIISLMLEHFRPDSAKEGYSLAIQGGADGARLTHNHERQYAFVLQSLTLWRNILHDMFKLWYLAEDDLLCEGHPYELKDTGQGFHRVQPAPNIARAMRVILHRTQEKVGSWVGSSVVHLGDTNVPNALMFIDKYTQVPRILSPIVLTLKQVHRMYANDALAKTLIDEYGGPERITVDILHDFFRFGFDGSGADNFFDAGSCIDGRLTSAWNWCSLLDQKPYYNIFKLTGFIGFDGDFQV